MSTRGMWYIIIRESRQHMYRINHRYIIIILVNMRRMIIVYNAEMDIMKIFWDYNNIYTRKHNVVSDLSVTLKGTQPH